MALTSKNLFITVLMILLNTGWMIVTGVTFKIIKDWKSAQEFLMKKTMNENLKYFIFDSVRRFDNILEVLSFGFIIGAIILAILIFRGGMEIFKKRNVKDEKSRLPFSLKDIEKAEKEEVIPTSGGCFFDIDLGEATIMPGGA